jgi:hypothetical protein
MGYCAEPSDEAVLGNNRWSVDSSGYLVDNGSSRIGIGKTKPSYPLDVSGNAYVTGNITATGTVTANVLSVVATPVTYLTASGTLPAANGGLSVLRTATTGTTFTLTVPDASTQIGMIYRVASDKASNALLLDPSATDMIKGLSDTAGDSITATTGVAVSICIIAADTNTWFPLSTYGTWTDSN